MKLEKNEYTTKSLVEYLRKRFKTKINGKQFTNNDIAQYLRRGYLPHRYGGNKIVSEVNSHNIRIITMS